MVEATRIIRMECGAATVWIIRDCYRETEVAVQGETIKIGPIPSGFHSWLYFMLIVLAGYGFLLKAGTPPTAVSCIEPVHPARQVHIPLEKFHEPQALNRKPLKLNIKKSKKFQVLIDQAAMRHAVDPDLVRAVIMAESGYNPNAVSFRGAEGLMQLMPRTAKAMGVKDAFNPEHNIDGGVRYLKKLLNRYDGNVDLALAAYNAGTRIVNKHRGVPPYKATHAYIRKVKEYFLFYKSYYKSNTNRV